MEPLFRPLCRDGRYECFRSVAASILIGDPKETLSRPGYVMISNRIAKLLGGAEQAVNKEFEFESSPGQTYTIGGVFEDVPENSHLRFEIVAFFGRYEQVES